MKTMKLLWVTLFSVALSACGGGSPSSTTTPVTSTLSFPAQSGYRAMVANGGTTNYTISSTCSGTENVVRSTPVSATFEGVAALAVTATTTVNYTQCTAASGTTTSTIYYDTSYANVGMSSSSQYVVLATPPVLPTSVKVGDTGTYGTANIYANSSKATLQGRFVLSYSVEADTENTAIVVFITKRYDASSVLQWTEQDRKRIVSSGTLTPVSIDRQSNVSADHLILTATTGGGVVGGALTATANTTAQNLTVGTAMSSFTPLTASGGSPPYTYSYLGTLPVGLSFNSSTGAITGTPTAAYATANLIFSVSDAGANVAKTTSTVSFSVTNVQASSINVNGVTANGIMLSGNFIYPVSVTAAQSLDGKAHTYYYWDISGNGTNGGVDYVTHDVLDQLFNGGTFGSSTYDTTDTSSTSTVTLSNGLIIHLPTTAELVALNKARGGQISFGHGWVDFGNWTSTRALNNYHYYVDMWSGYADWILDTKYGYVSFEVY